MASGLVGGVCSMFRGLAVAAGWFGWPLAPVLPKELAGGRLRKQSALSPRPFFAHHKTNVVVSTFLSVDQSIINQA